MQITKDGVMKVRRWKRACEEAANLERKLSHAKTELANAENDLAKFLLPKDAKASELFCVWVGDSLITAKHENGHASVMLRTRGKTWAEI